MSTFQIVLLMVFGVIGVMAVLIFGGIIPIPFGSNAQVFGGEVLLWGTLPSSSMRDFVSDFNSDHSNEYSLAYQEIDPARFESLLVSELASGRGPDLVLFPHSLLISQGDKLAPVPYASFSERTFKDSFIDEGDLYLTQEGIQAFPLYVDPLVMYWNKDLLSSAGIVEPPKVWEQFPGLPEKLTLRDGKGNITQSAVALGGIRNTEWSKDILSTLIMQVGDSIVTHGADGVVEATLGRTSDGRVTAAPAAVRFYTDFANPSKPSYSWNSALPNSKIAFESGQLAIYFGRASDYPDIKRKNPHLNFDVSIMPQRDKAQTKLAYAEMYGIGVLRATKNPQTAVAVLAQLTTPAVSAALSNVVGLPSASRVVLARPVSDPTLDVFNRAAVIGRGWLDPNPAETQSIFADMAESVIINKNTEEDAISDAERRLSVLLGR